MTFGRVGWLHVFPQAFITLQENNPNSFPVVRRSVGYVHPVDDPSTKYSFTESGFASSDLIAFELADGPGAPYAFNLRKAMAVPSIARKRVESWSYVLYSAALAARVAAACVICGVTNPNT